MKCAVLNPLSGVGLIRTAETLGVLLNAVKAHCRALGGVYRAGNVRPVVHQPVPFRWEAV